MKYPGPKRCYKCGRPFELKESSGGDSAKVTWREIAVVVTINDETYRYKQGDYGFCADCFIDALMQNHNPINYRRRRIGEEP